MIKGDRIDQNLTTVDHFNALRNDYRTRFEIAFETLKVGESKRVIDVKDPHLYTLLCAEFLSFVLEKKDDIYYEEFVERFSNLKIRNLTYIEKIKSMIMFFIGHELLHGVIYQGNTSETLKYTATLCCDRNGNRSFELSVIHKLKGNILMRLVSAINDDVKSIIVENVDFASNPLNHGYGISDSDKKLIEKMKRGLKCLDSEESEDVSLYILQSTQNEQ